VTLLDVASLRVVATLRGHTNTVTSLAFSPDGTVLVTTSGDQTARVWDVATDPPVCRFVLQHPLEVPNAAFSPDGRLLATTCIDRMLRVFRLADGALISTFGSSSLLPKPVAFFDSTTVAGVESGGSVRCWNVQASATTVLRGHRAPVEHVVLAPRFGAVVSAGVEAFRGEKLGLRFVDVESGDPIAEYDTDGSVVRAVELAADGTTLHLQLAGLADRLQLHQCKLDLRTGVRTELPATNRGVGFTLDPAGREIAVAEDALAIVDATSGQPLRRSAPLNAVPQQMWWSRDGQWLFGLFRPSGDAIGSQGVLFDARTLREVRRFAPSQEVAFTVSPDERLVALAGGDAIVRVFDLHDGARLAELRGHDLAVFCLAFSPDGRRLASSGHDRGIRIWDVATFAPVARLSGHEDTVMDLLWDGNERLISCGHDDTVRIWEAAPLRTRVAAHTARQAAVARMQPRVAALFAATHDASRVFAAIEGDASLGELDRKVAHQVALRTALARPGTK
jgi:WD40 repeat protein